MAQTITVEKTVTTIPARLSRFTDLPLTATAKCKVAAYAHVSTDHEEQQSSYKAQVNYYTEYIKSRTDWEFAGIFADEVISGCSIKGRQGFQAMIEEALNGGIKLIITKSVSRFARNTVDSLSTIHKLKEHNVECYFEKENIWTFDSKCELMLSILSSISQEESRSISENVTWGHRRRIADGKVSVPFGRFLGYDRGEHAKKYQLAMERYEAAKSKYEDLAAQVAEAHRKQRAVETFINNVQKLGVITEFDETLWGLLEDKVVVYSKDDIRVEFKK